MDITLTPLASGSTATTLCSDAARSTAGTPVGPADLTVVEAPGVEMREYVGADRVAPEHVRCNHGTITFRATRTYATAALAVAYALSGHRSEPVVGELKFGTTTIYPRATVTSKRIAIVGCTVSVHYTIEG